MKKQYIAPNAEILFLEMEEACMVLTSVKTIDTTGDSAEKNTESAWSNKKENNPIWGNME